ncbi:MAG: HAD-IA family hydrolase [Firmicutes bacterium]|nr:HAD-IA family hydrolase [Bacillota bacterium]
MINTVLFDFDGTLVNTNDVIIASWQHTYMHYRGREESIETITSCFGEPLLITMEREFPGVDPQESAEVYRTYQQQNAHLLVKIFPGIVDLLKALKEAGYRMGIVTSRTRESALRYMDMFGITEYFEAMVTCDDTTVHKPNPEPILLGLEKMGITKDEAIMVGDSPFDIKCANNAGVKSVMVDWRITCDNSVLITDAVWDYEIKEPMDLLQVLAEDNR